MKEKWERDFIVSGGSMAPRKPSVGMHPTWFQLPHLFVAIATAAFATIPLLPFSARFSLRTLLITMTAIAVGLWFIVWMAQG